MDEHLKTIEKTDQVLQSYENIILDAKVNMASLNIKRSELVAKTANIMIENGVTQSTVNGLIWCIRNTPQKIMIEDESKLPDKFIKERVTKTPNKTLLKTAIKNGESIEGVYLTNGSVTLVAKAATKKA